jgi:cytochrome c peroxidase
MHHFSAVLAARPRSVLAAAGLLALPLLLANGPSPAAQQMGPHGAALEARQLAELERLLPGRPAPSAPPHVDPVSWRARFPEGRVPTAGQAELGRRLFFDPRLSKDDTVSCATCHDVTRAFADRRPVSEGIQGQLGRRNAPTVMNAALLSPLFWDGRAADVETQALMPLTNPIEMGFADPAEALARIGRIAEYTAAFEEQFPDGLTFENVGRALGAFQRTLIFLEAPFDRFLAGDEQALSAPARAGWALFNGRAGCATCHPLSPATPLGTDQRFHNLGVVAQPTKLSGLAEQVLATLAADPSEAELDRLALATDLSDLGRFMQTRERADIGAFKTPQLRNVGLTAPYMHDGSMITLWDVVDHLGRGGQPHEHQSPLLKPLELEDAEVEALVAFLFSLTDRRFADFNQQQFEFQRRRAGLRRPFRAEPPPKPEAPAPGEPPAGS